MYGGHFFRSWSSIHVKGTNEAGQKAEVEKLDVWLLGVLERALNNKEWKDARDEKSLAKIFSTAEL